MRFIFGRRTYSCFFIFLISLFSQFTAQASKKTPAEQRADFLIKLAKEIELPGREKNKTFRLAVYGRGREIRALYDHLVWKSAKLRIGGKKVEVLQFKRVRKIDPVDMMYLSGEERIRFNDVTEQLGKRPHYLVTENYPFGTSMLNISFDKKKELIYELQQPMFEQKGARVSERLLNDKNRITSEAKWKARFKQVSALLDKERVKTSEQQKEISVKEALILEQERLIFYQRLTIVSVIVFLAIVGAMSFFLSRLNKEKKAALDELSVKNKKITSSINYARRIQAAMLPVKSAMSEGFADTACVFKPKDIVSGDFYWHAERDGAKLIAVADCTGHGVPGGFMSMMGNELLNKASLTAGKDDPADMLELLNRDVVASLRKEGAEQVSDDGMDIALCSFDFGKKTLRYAGANHPLLMVREGEQTLYKPTRRGIGGARRSAKPFVNNEIELREGDVLYMFSDGFQDQFGGPENKKYMRKRLCQFLADISSLPLEEQGVRIEREFEEWKSGGNQMDDMCVVALKV
ncbi:hypothetical protein FUAX_44810 (plasmid) [Fulvitalea axinellae]|uniref:PPM-type phosphatase domain-containing protein n=1 Tax=Fulvitalea axinellae TaxID=1182444 RepID=A0AAU9DC45_9BACT|nr:hypothetical protein FUAX_44810 [Fulvitalea axinellae]